MIRTVVLLARTSLLTMLFLASALLTLVSVLSNPPEDAAEPGAGLAAALAPVPSPRVQTGEGAAALRIALFDPERRPETVAGSIDDLRSVEAPPPAPANVAISGVLIDGHKAEAMLNVVGGAPGWTDVGAEIGGWRVARIDAEGAVLEHDGLSLDLKVADRWKTRGQSRSATSPADVSPTPEATTAPSGSSPQGDAPAPPDAVEPPKP